jgi:hypothetical protein
MSISRPGDHCPSLDVTWKLPFAVFFERKSCFSVAELD